jgi:hypothetical protein
MADDERPPEETPWGTERDEPDKLFAGFWWIYTSRHGGLYLTAQQREAIPESLKAHSRDGTGVWWEENTAWSLPVICLLSKRPEASLSENEQEVLQRAHNTAQDEYPDEWEHLTGRKLEPGESQGRDENWEPSSWTLEWKAALAEEAEAERLKSESRTMPYEPSDEEKRLAELAQQYRDRLIEQAKELEQKYKDPATPEPHKERINSYLNLREQHADHFRDLVATHDPEIRNPDIVNAQHRFGKASATHFHFDTAFESLVATDQADYGIFNRQQNHLAEKISTSSDVKAQEALKTRKLIEAYEYLDRTARHIALQSNEITGRPDNPESVSMTRAAEGTNDSPGYLTRAFHLRKHYRELQPEPTIGHSFQAKAQDIVEKPPDRLDRLIEEQDRIARAKQEPVRTDKPKERERDRER